LKNLHKDWLELKGKRIALKPVSDRLA